MNLSEIRGLAREAGVRNIHRMRKAAIIHEIQQREGNFACFGSATDGYCDQWECRWRADCLPASAKRD